MKYFVFIIAIAIGFSGCGTSVETNSVTTTNTANSNAPNANQSNTNRTAETNSPPIRMQSNRGIENTNASNFNAPNITIDGDKIKPKKDELPVGSVTAIDDSIVSSQSRGKDFVETRTFKNHPLVSKIEKVMNGKTSVYKIYLKNGKVVDAPPEKMTNYATMPVSNILDDLGLQPKPTPNGAVEKKGKQ